MGRKIKYPLRSVLKRSDMVVTATRRFVIVENRDEERRVSWWRSKSCSRKMSLYKSRERDSKRYLPF